MKKEFNKSLIEICKLVWWISNKKDLKSLFEDILTPKEIQEINERINIIKLLKKWLPQRQIAQKLGISITTVNRWSRVLKYWNWSLKKLIN